MASGLFDAAREDFAEGDIDLIADTIRCVLAKAGFALALTDPDPTLADVAAGDRIASALLTGKTVAAGVFDADDVLYPGLAAGQTGTQLLIYRDSGAEATSRIIARIDDYAGLPITTSGVDVRVTWPNTPNRIFKL